MMEKGVVMRMMNLLRMVANSDVESRASHISSRRSRNGS